MPPRICTLSQSWSVLTPHSRCPTLTARKFETLLYGIYIALFFVSIHILLRNKRTLQPPLLVLAILMFAIATADIGVTYAYLLRCLLRGEITPFKYIYPKLTLYKTNK
ncbi:hypothetical protein BD779DRAFT_715648 [Infundibulicybe gibba]|nr:hypothetical protein BD779DRAFT_715648 [Infundibulicybe gibba]